MKDRRVDLFRHGRQQSVRIPRESERPGQEVILPVDNGLSVLAPETPMSLLGDLNTMQAIEEEWPEIDDPEPGASGAGVG